MTTALAPPPVARPAAHDPEPEARTVRRLELSFDGGADMEVLVTGVREQVAEAVLEGESSPVLPVGGVAQARLWVRGLGRPLCAVIRVVSRIDAGEQPRYALALPQLGQRGGALTAALCAAFNRRSSQRVRPEPLAAPWVTLQADDGRGARGPLGDISLGGLSVQVAPEAEALLASADHVTLTVQLPCRPEPVSARASIRSRRLCGSRIRYGLEFEADGPTRSAVLDYVRERRDACLNRARRTAEPELL